VNAVINYLLRKKISDMIHKKEVEIFQLRIALEVSASCDPTMRLTGFEMSRQKNTA
jgi:hypothetical protein